MSRDVKANDRISVVSCPLPSHIFPNLEHAVHMVVVILYWYLTPQEKFSQRPNLKLYFISGDIQPGIRHPALCDWQII